MHIDSAMLQGLKDWKQMTQFSGPNDWMFASPSQIGRLPISHFGSLADASNRSGQGWHRSH